jgi:3-hydroxybutyrate dehydrogenase
MDTAHPLAGQVAVITGAGRGIGAAIALKLASLGATTVLCGRTQSTLDATATAILDAGGKTEVIPCDVTILHQMEYASARVDSTFGRLDILVNNAGVQFVSPIEDFPIEKWDQIIAINLTSAFHTIRAAVPIMKAAGHGRIVNIASAHALVASPFKGAYVAAKHGILGLTKTVALEVAQAGITCNAICPGYVKTPLVEAQIADQAKARHMTPEQVMSDVILAAQPTKRFVEFDQLAGLMLYLASDAGASVNGAALPIDGGWTAH